jgi:16S rRNA (guanine966-N2)-methyltransferase
MRIIAGKYRSRILKSPPSMNVRPTSDRLRETLFNVIAARMEGARVLDLCAGSGAVGIEALSRGAAHVTFVDQSRKMCGLIETNLDLLEIPEEQTVVVHSEASEFLRQSFRRKAKSWDIAFLDPPYSTNYLKLLEYFSSHAAEFLSPDGLLIVEHHRKNELSDQMGTIIRSRILKQGDSALSFYRSALSSQD